MTKKKLLKKIENLQDALQVLWGKVTELALSTAENIARIDDRECDLSTERDHMDWRIERCANKIWHLEKARENEIAMVASQMKGKKKSDATT